MNLILTFDDGNTCQKFVYENATRKQIEFAFNKLEFYCTTEIYINKTFVIRWAEKGPGIAIKDIERLSRKKC